MYKHTSSKRKRWKNYTKAMKELFLWALEGTMNYFDIEVVLDYDNDAGWARWQLIIFLVSHEYHLPNMVHVREIADSSILW